MWMWNSPCSENSEQTEVLLHCLKCPLEGIGNLEMESNKGGSEKKL